MGVLGGSLRDRVRALHVPDGSLACAGCDAGAYAEGGAEWPCRTAVLVYGAHEISRMVEAAAARIRGAVAAEWAVLSPREREQRQNMVRVFAPLIGAQLAGAVFFKRPTDREG